jgi:putative Holliday junction resolvase
MSRILAVDFGLKRIGLALSDERRRVALPLATVEGGKNAVQNVLKQVGSHSILAIVIGLPLTLKGERGEMVTLVEKFGGELGQAIDAPVIYIDERLSSKAADVSLREISLNRKKRNERIDLATATMILQSYLDTQREIDK